MRWSWPIASREKELSAVEENLQARRKSATATTDFMSIHPCRPDHHGDGSKRIRFREDVPAGRAIGMSTQGRLTRSPSAARPSTG